MGEFLAADTHLSNFRRIFFDYCCVWGKRLAQTLLPQQCLCCGLAAAAPFCADCWQSLPWHQEPQCPRCALPQAQGQICGRCLQKLPAYDRTIAAWTYSWPLAQMIPAFKYEGRLELNYGLSLGLARQLISAPRPDYLLAMPQHPSRVRERGYNQAALLARALAKQLNIPFLPSAVLRIKHNPPQASLKLKSRQQAVRGAFICARRFDGLHLAVVDDVMTSGASMDALACSLKESGAQQVDCWVLARTLRNH